MPQNSVSERRRLQNRVAQREYRKRMREIGMATKSPHETQENPDQDESLSISPRIYTSKSSSQTFPSPPLVASATTVAVQLEVPEEAHFSTSWLRRLVKKADLHKLTDKEIMNMMMDFENSVLLDYQLGSPRTDQLLTLVQFNVFRALLSNTNSIGFTTDWLSCDAVSAWSTGQASCSSLTRCPLDLKPTVLQTTIPHHPWIDLLPAPEMRDNLLLAAGAYDEDELCNVLVDFIDVPNEKSGLIVWGEPWDSAGWEISENLLRNWAWVVRGCQKLQVATNHWRRRRNEKELVFEPSL